MAQIIPLPKECSTQIISVVAWFMCQGAIFRVPVSTLQGNKKDGSMDLCDVEAKGRTLLLSRMWTQGKQSGTIPAEWQEYWNLSAYVDNPPQICRIP
jgi:hypothetical protein